MIMSNDINFTILTVHILNVAVNGLALSRRNVLGPSLKVNLSPDIRSLEVGNRGGSIGTSVTLVALDP